MKVVPGTEYATREGEPDSGHCTPALPSTFLGRSDRDAQFGGTRELIKKISEAEFKGFTAGGLATRFSGLSRGRFPRRPLPGNDPSARSRLKPGGILRSRRLLPRQPE